VLCENCKKNPATFHVVEILDGEKREVHLCEKCAQEKKVALPPSLSLNEILGSLMEAHAEKEVPELDGVACPKCGMTYAEFKSGGRLGCPRDYAVFRKGLLPFLERVHGARKHNGKTPRREGPGDGQAAKLMQLRRELKTAVEAERYEEAAALRDRIRDLRAGQ
jgi:protein arginine kinase activator